MKSLLILLLIPSLAFAEQMPWGCYIDRVYLGGPGNVTCWIPADGRVDLAPYPGLPYYKDRYGAVMGTLAFNNITLVNDQNTANAIISDYDAALTDCQSKNTNLTNQSVSLITQLKTVNDQLASANAKITKLNKQIKKLKKR